MEPSDNANPMKNKKRLKFDWSELLHESDEPTPELIITSSTAVAESRNPSENLILDMDAHQNLIDNMEKKKDDEINSSIKRYRDLKKLSRALCDKGAKLDAMLERLEAEKERRKLLAVEKGPNDFVSTKQSANLTKNYFIDASDALGKEQTFSNEGLPSSFTSLFSSRLENIHSRSSVDFDKVSYRPTNGDQHENQFKRDFFARDRGKASSRHQPFQSPMLGSSVTNRDKKSIDHVMSLSYPKPAQDQMVLLDEEDEGQLEVIKRSDEFVECTEDATIYYPSRDDPNSVEICYKDTKCLDPEGYLTSPIMNFYITVLQAVFSERIYRYLQQQASLSNKGINDYHFFNTYFYKKLQDAVSDKGNEKGVSFAKFRRWWKGVNIFEKAYVLIPIHENLHWSLAIICIPDKKDESGPVILHLDSLELHRSKSIFDNIKSFLIEEWRYLNEQSASLDLLIVDQVWELLPSLIGVTTIAVPQQKNDYDCGLFVLYFMQRFMEEAPKRLRKRDLHMFGKRWFKPEDASSLRSRIRRLLIKEFRKVTRDDNDDEPTPTPNNTLGSEMDCTLIDAAEEAAAEVVSS